MMPNDSNRILQQVGLLWIVLGLIDIIYFVYRVTADMNPSSHVSVNIVTIVIGVFLWRGNLKLARWTGNFLPFLLVIFYGVSFASLVAKPLELWAVELRQYPTQTIAYWLYSISQLAILVWTCKQLRSQTMLEVYAAAGMDTKFPKVALGFVSGLVLVFAFWIHSLMTGEDAATAKRLAQAKLGTNYTYHVTGMRWSGNQVSASVAAYSDNEIRSITVGWNKDKPRS
ncbi:MAG TPA: hypothetical protein IGS53_22540 [Leptolyngbyaceae cyanobacterium M33_DOE_097]|nr:hypothetical protein [Leptolyngbyaceae cyanobacterium M33_DOE_097]